MTTRIHKVAADFEIVSTVEYRLLDPHLEAKVQALWEDEKAQHRLSLYNGRIFSIETLSSERASGAFVEYRMFIAQRRRPELFESLQIKPLAISGLLECQDGLVFGRRARDLATEGDKWELLPAGSLEPESNQTLGSVDYLRQFYRELAEEVGITKAETDSPRPLLLIEDLSAHVFDLVIAARIRLQAAQIIESFECNAREHSELKVVPPSEVQAFVGKEREAIVTSTVALLEYYLPSVDRQQDALQAKT